jgi:predicted ATPase
MILKIENFKCFRKTEIPFEKITVLAGANSVGKSSVVQSLLLIRSIIEKGISMALVQGLINQDDYQNAPIGISLNGPFLLNLGVTQEVLNREALTNQIKFSISDEKSDLLIMTLDAPLLENSYNLKLIGFDNFSQLKQGDFPVFYTNFYYLNAERIGPRIRYEVDDLPYLHVGWQGEFSIQVIGMVKNTLEISENRCADKHQIRGLLHQCRLWLERIAPGTMLDDANIINEMKTAYVSFNQSKPTNVGFGISYVLPIIINGLLAKENSMFIVENPEAHLHPLGQSQIGKFLALVANDGVNVIVETHSEHVINGIRIASLNGEIAPNKIAINYFHKNESKQIEVKTIKINESGDLTSYPKGFFDQEQRDMAEIIRKKRSKIIHN